MWTIAGGILLAIAILFVVVLLFGALIGALADAEQKRGERGLPPGFSYLETWALWRFEPPKKKK